MEELDGPNAAHHILRLIVSSADLESTGVDGGKAEYDVRILAIGNLLRQHAVAGPLRRRLGLIVSYHSAHCFGANGARWPHDLFVTAKLFSSAAPSALAATDVERARVFLTVLAASPTWITPRLGTTCALASVTVFTSIRA